MDRTLKSVSSFILSITCFASSSAWAAEQGEISESDGAQKRAKHSFLSMKNNAPGGSAGQRAVALPKAAAGVLAGLTIGIPVKISKDVRKETRRMAGTLRGDVGNDLGILETGFVMGGALPFGLLSGSILGLVRGTERAFTYGAQQPFSKESLGLKEPEQDPREQQ